MLVTVSAPPESQLVVWSWEKEKVFLTSPLPPVMLTRISCPLASTAASFSLTATGPGYLRVWAVMGGNALKQTAMVSQAQEQENYVDHCWLKSSTDTVACVTEGTSITTAQGASRGASILLFRQGGVAGEAGASSKGGKMGDKGGDKNAAGALELVKKIPVLLRGKTRLECIANYGKGFILGGTNGFFSVYEKTDDRKDPFMLIKTFYYKTESFYSICANFNDEQVVAFSKTQRLLSFPLGSIDMIDESEVEDNFLDVSPGGLHQGSIIDMDLCMQKPLLVTVGADRTVRIYNYVKWNCELVQDFTNDEPTCVAFHPNGLQLILGFNERIRMYNCMRDELKLFRDMPLKGCRELKFSSGGQYFAAAVGYSVSVYSTNAYNSQTIFQQLYTFTGHIGPVKRLLWSPDDLVLYSAGMDGNVYGWDLVKNTRLDDANLLNRPTSYTGLVAEFSTKESKYNRVAACSPDGYMVELSWHEDKRDSHVLKTIDCGENPADTITALALSNNKKFLFMGTAGGNVKTCDWPLDSEKPIMKTYSVHQPITHSGAGGTEIMKGIISISVSQDDNYLFTTAADGSIFVLGMQVVVRGLETKATLDPDMRMFNNDAVLVSIDEVDERTEQIIELTKKLEELKNENEMALHMKDMDWQAELKAISEERDSIIQSERTKYSLLQEKFDSTVRKHNEEVELKDAYRVQVVQENENQYEHKLAVEMERFDRLAEEIEAMQQKCEGLLEAQAADHERHTRQIEQKASKTEKLLAMQISRMKDDMEHNEAMYREVLDQQEAEYETELQKLMSVAESDLIGEQESTRKMQAIVQTLNTKRAQLKKKNEELKLKTANHEIEYAKEKSRRVKLEETLSHIELHMKEREDALSDKEKTILGLRSTNKTLDNFRYVLDHRLQQLMKERGPIQKHIEGLEKHVRAMYDELVGEFNKKKEIDRTLDQKQLKINTQDKEIVSVRNSLRESERQILSIKRDLTAMVGSSHPKELEEMVKEAYRKFVRGETIKNKGGGSSTASGGGNGFGKSSTRRDMGKTGASMKSTIRSTTTSNIVDPAQPPDEENVYSSGRNVYSRGGGGGGGGDDGNENSLAFNDQIELEEKALEAQRQTRWVQKEAKDLKRRLEVETNAAEKDRANKLNENASLIKECNALRRENVEMKRDKEALAHEINDMKERARRRKMLSEASHSRGGSQFTPGANSGVDAPNSMMSNNSGFLDPAEEPQTPLMGKQMRVSKSLAELEQGNAYGNNRGGGGTGPGLDYSQSDGRLLKGSRARQSGSQQTLRNETIILQKKLDERQRETEMQRIEINRLRETLRNMAMSSAGTKKQMPFTQPSSSKVLYGGVEGSSGVEGGGGGGLLVSTLKN